MATRRPSTSARGGLSHVEGQGTEALGFCFSRCLTEAMAVIALPITLIAQPSPPPASRVVFDAASVKRNTSGGTSMQVRTPPGQFTMVKRAGDDAGVDRLQHP